MKSEIKTFVDLNDNGEVSPNIQRNTLKAILMGKIISLSSAIKKEKKLKKLESTLKDLEKAYADTQETQMLSKAKEVEKYVCFYFLLNQMN